MPARNKVVIGGVLGEGGECNWSVGIHYGGGVGGSGVIEDQSLLQAWAAAIGSAISGGTLIGPNMYAGITGDGAVNEVLTYYYPDGNGPALAVGQSLFARGGTGAVSNPAQTSVVMSLRTGIAGRSYRGRNYWPGLGYGMTGALKFTASVSPILASEYAAFLTGIGDLAGDADLVPCVYSATLQVMTPVIEVAVGDVPDTQRRRRDPLVETYSVEQL